MKLLEEKQLSSTAFLSDIKKDPHRYAVEVCDATMLKDGLLLANKISAAFTFLMCKKY